MSMASSRAVEDFHLEELQDYLVDHGVLGHPEAAELAGERFLLALNIPSSLPA